MYQPRMEMNLEFEDVLTLFGLVFCQPKKTEGPKGPPSLNLDISSQMTMKLGKDILWAEIFTN